jgi:hypothetical protein
MTAPVTATMPSDRPTVTARPARVSAGDRHYQHLPQRHECLCLRYPGRHHYAERGEREGKQKKLTDYREYKNGVVRYMRKPGQRQNDDSLNVETVAPPRHFPDNDR